LVEACANLAELVAKWNGYDPWKRALSLSFSAGTTNAAKYAARFEALFALLDLCIAAVLRQVAVKSFAGIADLQRHAEHEANETRRAFSAAALAQGMVLDDVRTLQGQLEALSRDLAGVERGLAEVGKKVDQVSGKVDGVMSEIGKVHINMNWYGDAVCPPTITPAPATASWSHIRVHIRSTASFRDCRHRPAPVAQRRSPRAFSRSAAVRSSSRQTAPGGSAGGPTALCLRPTLLRAPGC
jgi:hypothetical protein